MRTGTFSKCFAWGSFAVALAAAPALAVDPTGVGVIWSGPAPDENGEFPDHEALPTNVSLTNMTMITQLSQLTFAVSTYADFIAVDQPRVLWKLEHPNPVGDQEPVIGPSEFFAYGVLDTGANGVVLGAMSYFDFEADTFFSYDRFGRAQRSDNSYVQYEETGVAGTQFLDVLAPYNLQVFGRSDVLSSTPTFTVANTNVLGAVHRETNPELPNFGQGTSAADFGSFSAIVGMPAMVGRVVEMDLRPIAGFFDFGEPPPGVPPFDLMIAEFHNAMPVATANSLTVKLTKLKLPDHLTQPQQPGDPLPTFKDVPLLSVTAKNYAAGGTISVTRNVLLDTGAQTSIFSTNFVESLGISLDPEDANNKLVDLDGDGDWDGEDMLEVGGLGGTSFMPLVLIDDLVIPTTDKDGNAVDVIVHQLVVGVLDIGGEGENVLLDGVFGMNILTSGYSDLIFAGNGQFGRFSQVYLDFLDEDDWSMRLEVNPDFAAAAPEPASIGLIFLGGAALLRRRRRCA